ncbi:MAG: acetyltransferase [Burkholderiaceae bacterium]|nr:acetyltransferase [Burkholderiaceae bacterium]
MSATRVVVFGASTFSSLAWYCLTHDSEHEVVAFTVDSAFMTGSVHEGLPVVPFEDLSVACPPDDVQLLIPMGYQQINGLRRARYETAKSQGYRFVSYVSGRAGVWPDLQVGENCLIFDHAIIQPFAQIGDNVIVRSGAIVSHHCALASHVFVSAGAHLGGNVSVGEQAFIGLGAVLKHGLAIAPQTFVAAGAVVLADTEADGVYIGNPARRISRAARETI